MANTQIFYLLLLALAYGSMLPRLIHADHVSTVSRAVADATDSNDVEGLTALQNSYIILQFSTGDPCFGLGGPWSWVECSTDTPSRITALNLKNAGLIGPLPDFSSMDALETIDFSQNYVTGSIPSFLGTLPHLTTLDLSNNGLSGTVPDSISNNKNLDTYIGGNPNLSVSGTSDSNNPSSDADQQYYYSTDSKKKSKIGVIVGVVSSVVLIVSIVVGVLAIINHNKRKAAAVAAANNAIAAAAAGNGRVAAQKEEMVV
ncbi:putative leucine-rich repeat receptor-like protein kinase At2g19210 [Impatiens glandulifera]|uniref:putative leucine-rich repeat receptor-like protein kinase At2g19210 n=1 Tax=Impatiens glandulifera TaxID=253017 RepID=UPI001FB06620|nr:putative leucine-rich repeat receptor-like protein kinase At2g19210 [Impatiens glandulifera]